MGEGDGLSVGDGLGEAEGVGEAVGLGVGSDTGVGGPSVPVNVGVVNVSAGYPCIAMAM